jgi:hypothetical protein
LNHSVGNVFLNNKISSNRPLSIDFVIGGKLPKKVLRFTDVEKTGAHFSNPNFADSSLGGIGYAIQISIYSRWC